MSDESLQPPSHAARTKLATYSALLQIPKYAPKEAQVDLTHEELCKLLGYASQKALSIQSEDKFEAYDICTRILEVTNDKRFAVFIRSILGRLGNFPGAQLLESRYLNELKGMGTPPISSLEYVARQSENTFEIVGEKMAVVTDFQAKLLEMSENEVALSISAPTSAGKSYALILDILRQIVRGSKVIVFVVPTRALIRQVMFDVLAQLSAYEFKGVDVLCVPEVITDMASRTAAIYVLTQERLMALLSASNYQQSVDVIYVDEAQGISDASRGILLESSVSALLNGNPRLKTVFSSPLIKNPEYFLKTFDRQELGQSFSDWVSPVAQNLFLVRSVKGKPKLADIAIRVNKEDIPLGIFDLARPLRDSEKLANIAAALTHDADSSIVFSNGPSAAEKVAAELSEISTLDNTNDKEVIAFVQFLKSYVHEKYPLVEMVKKGVAFHYSKMPHIVRAKVEELFKSRKLKFVVSTSTLLQGVNLPTKNIFMESPKSGKGRPMKSHDFWNLAGRAGRLLKEFHGNVWCVDVEKWDENHLDDGKQSEVRSAFADALDMYSGELMEAFSSPQDLTLAQKTHLEQPISMIITEFGFRGRKLADSRYASDKNRESLVQLDELVPGLLKNLMFEQVVYRRNVAISPLRLDNFGRAIQRLSAQELLPMYPYEVGSLDRLREVFKKIDEMFRGIDNRSHRFFASLAHKWMTEVTLKQLIDSKLEYEKVPDSPKDIGNAIRGLLQNIEEDLRFEYVKYLRAYSDIVVAVAKSKGIREDDLKIVPVHLYIEYGAASPVLINLMGLGLSRTSAILVKRKIDFADAATREEVIHTLVKTPIESLDLPEVCREELLSILKSR